MTSQWYFKTNFTTNEFFIQFVGGIVSVSFSGISYKIEFFETFLMNEVFSSNVKLNVKFDYIFDLEIMPFFASILFLDFEYQIKFCWVSIWAEIQIYFFVVQTEQTQNFIEYSAEYF